MGQTVADTASTEDKSGESLGLPVIRLAEIGLAALVVVLVAITLVVRTKRPAGGGDRSR
jgi:hypothetical protein